jgi:hypothetical protein
MIQNLTLLHYLTSNFLNPLKVTKQMHAPVMI